MGDYTGLVWTAAVEIGAFTGAAILGVATTLASSAFACLTGGSTLSVGTQIGAAALI